MQEKTAPSLRIALGRGGVGEIGNGVEGGRGAKHGPPRVSQRARCLRCGLHHCAGDGPGRRTHYSKWAAARYRQCRCLGRGLPKWAYRFFSSGPSVEHGRGVTWHYTPSLSTSIPGNLNPDSPADGPRSKQPPDLREVVTRGARRKISSSAPTQARPPPDRPLRRGASPAGRGTSL